MAEPAAQLGNQPRSPVQLVPLAVPKASDVLAEELRERILGGDISEGAALPRERDLVMQTGMSRTTVREALRILEIQGLVCTKAGRAGGAFVQRPGSESVVSSIDLLIRGRQIHLSTLLKTRGAIEPVCARLAAQHRTSADIEALQLANERIADLNGSVTDFLKADVDWHVAVAVATHNELITAFMVGLGRATYVLTENETFVDPEVRSIAVHEHQVITQAIEKQGGDAALRHMTRHIQAHTYEATGVERKPRAPRLTPNPGEPDGPLSRTDHPHS